MFNLRDVIWATPLGDQRRNARLLEIVTGLIQSGEPQAEDAVHAPGEATPWAHTMGCFRFYRNDALALPALYEPCRAALAELVPPGRRAYVICDISTVDYSHHATKPDRIRVGNERGRGYELFSALVVDDAGRPLGPVAQEVHTADGCLSSEAWEPLPFVNHYEQVERAMRAADLHLPGRDLVVLVPSRVDHDGGAVRIQARHRGAGEPAPVPLADGERLRLLAVLEGVVDDDDPEAVAGDGAADPCGA